jgi:di/tricarboxylate transporter
MDNSKQIAGLVGPTTIVVVLGEYPLVQPHLYDQQIPPVAYVSGVLLFVAGLAILRIHNKWVRDWTVLITLTGWIALLSGLQRIFMADAYARFTRGASANPMAFMVVESVLLLIGIVVTFNAWRR